MFVSAGGPTGGQGRYLIFLCLSFRMHMQSIICKHGEGNDMKWNEMKCTCGDRNEMKSTWGDWNAVRCTCGEKGCEWNNGEKSNELNGWYYQSYNHYLEHNKNFKEHQGS